MSKIDFKTRIIVFLAFCWMSFSGMVAGTGWGGFKWDTFFWLGAFPLVTIALIYWTFSDYFLKAINITRNYFHSLNLKKNSATQRPGERILNPIAQVTGWAIGIIFGKIFGVYLAIPAVAAVVFALLIGKFEKFKSANHYLLAGSSILFGHATWILFGTILTGSTDAIFDLTWMYLALCALVSLNGANSRVALWLVVSLEVISLFVNLSSLSQASKEQTIPLMLHLILRVSVISLFLISDFRAPRSDRQDSQPESVGKAKKIDTSDDEVA